ncbi:MAG: hypothetical protein M1837_006547 [Sclerophora amabilis]|nr:MAG: hypothetical protein M1837_006547 [Sclerophora amabilis]
MASAPQVAPIPLHCTLCPKKPSFSDISHLLTHIASKGHLAHEFKLSIRTSTDHAAKQQLDAYQQWYDRHGLERLLTNRMVIKEARKAKESESHRKITDHVQSRPERVTQQQPRKTSTALTSRSFDHLEEPLYPNRFVDESKCLAPSHAPDLTTRQQSSSQPSGHAPRLHLWPTSIQRLQETPEPLESSATSTPVSSSLCELSAFISASADDQTDRHSQKTISSCAVQSERAETVDLSSEDLENVGGEAQLKGVFWPGMNIFDSATADMKRKRNQRKDGSLLAQMEYSSTKVAPTEVVFGPNGTFRRERRISGLLEDLPSTQKKNSRGKSTTKRTGSALAEVSANVPRSRHRTGLGHDVSHTKTKRPSHSSKSKSVVAEEAVNGCQFHREVDGVEQCKLETDPPRRKRRRDITVFDDSREDGGGTTRYLPEHVHGLPSLSSGFNSALANDHELNLLNSEFPYPSSVEYPIGSHLDAPHHRPGALMSGRQNSRPCTVRSSGKENVEPILDNRGRIDTETDCFNQDRKLQQMFNDDSFHYSHFYSPDRHSPDQADFSGLNNYDFSTSSLSAPFSAANTAQFPFNFDHWAEADFAGDLTHHSGEQALGFQQAALNFFDEDEAGEGTYRGG